MLIACAAAPVRADGVPKDAAQSLVMLPSFALQLLRLPAPAVHSDPVPSFKPADGRCIVRYMIQRITPALYVQVQGKVEFERADIHYADGSEESVDAFGLVRDDGMYRLASFGTRREVEWVRLVFCAESKRARLDVAIEE